MRLEYAAQCGVFVARISHIGGGGASDIIVMSFDTKSLDDDAVGACVGTRAHWDAAIVSRDRLALIIENLIHIFLFAYLSLSLSHSVAHAPGALEFGVVWRLVAVHHLAARLPACRFYTDFPTSQQPPSSPPP